MFGDYTIATASCHPSSLPHHGELNRSSLHFQHDSSYNLQKAFSRHLSIGQLSQRLSEQHIHQESIPHIRSDPFQMAQADDSCSFESSISKSYVGAEVPSRRRLQRQQGMRMLCDPSHLRNIQDMVEKMVQANDQCSVTSPRATAMTEDGLPDPKDDEGYSSLEDRKTLSRHDSASSSTSLSSCNSESAHKRSGDLSTKRANVCKSVRIRKTLSSRSTAPRTP